MALLLTFCIYKNVSVVRGSKYDPDTPLCEDTGVLLGRKTLSVSDDSNYVMCVLVMEHKQP